MIQMKNNAGFLTVTDNRKQLSDFPHGPLEIKVDTHQLEAVIECTAEKHGLPGI